MGQLCEVTEGLNVIIGFVKGVNGKLVLCELFLVILMTLILFLLYLYLIKKIIIRKCLNFIWCFPL